jgi:hypothetical protein
VLVDKLAELVTEPPKGGFVPGPRVMSDQRSKPLVTTPGDEASAVERMEADDTQRWRVAVVPRQQPCDGSCPIDDALQVTPTTGERPYELLGLGSSPLVDGHDAQTTTRATPPLL